MAGKVDVAELRRLKAEYLKSSPGDEIQCTYCNAVMKAAPALLNEIERLQKIEGRLPKKCCLTCKLLGVRCLQCRQPLCTDWLPLDGEKEE